MWRFLAESAAGTSHERSGSPCQDSHRVSEVVVDGTYYLVVVCSDGAGSASHSDLGSKVICETILQKVCEYLNGKRTLAGVDRDTAIGWLDQVRDSLRGEAELHSVEVRQLAGTLLLAVIGGGTNVYLQVGDGAIVTLAQHIDAKPEAVFWPQNGEYANTTHFVTDEGATKVAMFDRRNSEPAAIAVFSDGMQMLALDYATKSAHAPFFTPLFRLLADAPEPSDLAIPFRQFLCSDSVNRRTDDDKTLVVGVRVPARGN